MKKVFFMALAAAAMVSCSNDEVVDLNQEAIAFGDNFIENSTRAIDPSYSTEALTQFNVWGSVANDGETAYIPIFTNDNVEGTVGAGIVWECTTKTQYWIAGRKYNFAAIVNNSGTGTVYCYGNKLPGNIVGFTSDGTTDLLYARSATDIVGLASGNVPVNFTFNHMLAKVQFTVENTTNLGNSENSGFYYKVENVTINDINTVGTCYFTTPIEWEDVNTTTDLAFGNVTNVNNKANVGNTDAIAIADRATATTHYARMVIPYDYGTGTSETTDDLSVSFTLNIYEAGGNTLMLTEDVTKTVPVKFEAGHAYNFVIKKTMGQPIQFSVTTAPTWTNGTAPDIQL